jgi:hypothetical protein
MSDRTITIGEIEDLVGSAFLLGFMFHQEQVIAEALAAQSGQLPSPASEADEQAEQERAMLAYVDEIAAGNATPFDTGAEIRQAMQGEGESAETIEQVLGGRGPMQQNMRESAKFVARWLRTYRLDGSK